MAFSLYMRLIIGIAVSGGDPGTTGFLDAVEAVFLARRTGVTAAAAQGPATLGLDVVWLRPCIGVSAQHPALHVRAVLAALNFGDFTRLKRIGGGGGGGGGGGNEACWVGDVAARTQRRRELWNRIKDRGFKSLITEALRHSFRIDSWFPSAPLAPAPGVLIDEEYYPEPSLDRLLDEAFGALQHVDISADPLPTPKEDEGTVESDPLDNPFSDDHEIANHGTCAAVANSEAQQHHSPLPPSAEAISHAETDTTPDGTTISVNLSPAGEPSVAARSGTPITGTIANPAASPGLPTLSTFFLPSPSSLSPAPVDTPLPEADSPVGEQVAERASADNYIPNLTSPAQQQQTTKGQPNTSGSVPDVASSSSVQHKATEASTTTPADAPILIPSPDADVGVDAGAGAVSSARKAAAEDAVKAAANAVLHKHHQQTQRAEGEAEEEEEEVATSQAVEKVLCNEVVRAEHEVHDNPASASASASSSPRKEAARAQRKAKAARRKERCRAQRAEAEAEVEAQVKAQAKEVAAHQAVEKATRDEVIPIEHEKHIPGPAPASGSSPTPKEEAAEEARAQRKAKAARRKDRRRTERVEAEELATRQAAEKAARGEAARIENEKRVAALAERVT